MNAGLRKALIEQDTTRNVGGEKRPANVGGVLPISFCGGPDRVVKQISRRREEIGVGVIDMSLADPGGGDVDAMMGGSNCSAKRSCRASARSERATSCCRRCHCAAVGRPGADF